MKKFLALVLVLCMVLSLCACGSSSSTTTADTSADTSSSDASASTGDSASADTAASGDNVIRIGVFEPMTGDSGAGGKQEMLGAQYANYLTPTVTVGGVEYTIELVYADNASTADKAPTAAAELVSNDVCVVLGSYGSGVSIAGGPTFEDAGLAAIGLSCTNPQVTSGNDYYFRVCFLDPFQGTAQANFVTNELGFSKVYCLGELGNEYDTGLINYFTIAFEALGGEVVSDTFPTNTSDFSTYINKAVSNGCEAIFCPVSIAYATQIITMAGSMGLEMPILGGDTLDSNMVIAATEGTDLEVYVSTFYQEGADEEFDSGFKAWMNEDSSRLTNNGGNDTIAAVSVMGFDGYNTAIAAILAADSVEPGDIKAALGADGFSYTGVTGEIVFDETGDAVRDTAYIKMVDIANQSWTLAAVQTVE